MREIRPSGLGGGVALYASPLPHQHRLSHAPFVAGSVSPGRWQETERTGVTAAGYSGSVQGMPNASPVFNHTPGPLQCNAGLASVLPSWYRIPGPGRFRSGMQVHKRS